MISNQELLRTAKLVCLIFVTVMIFFAGIMTIMVTASQIRERQMIQNLIDIKRGEFGKP